MEEGRTMDKDLNVLGGALEPCSLDPVTGFFRNGRCSTGDEDAGCHAVCVHVSAEFLAFSQAAGNDLSTPVPAYDFPGLKPGDRWCLCAARWKQALDAGYAPPVYLRATHRAALQYVSRSILEEVRARFAGRRLIAPQPSPLNPLTVPAGGNFRAGWWDRLRGRIAVPRRRRSRP